jgi:predicted anti-sigma-YlaC factor YlaD
VERSDDELACRELVELVTEYFEGQLGEAERLRFEAHVAGCSGCRAYLDQMRTTLHVLGNIADATLAPEARAHLLAMYRSWMAG